MGEGPQRGGSDKDWCLANQLFMEPKETKAQRQVLNKEPRENRFRLLLLIPSLLRVFQLIISFPGTATKSPQMPFTKGQWQDYEATSGCRRS